jgi:hypothetical protein
MRKILLCEYKRHPAGYSGLAHEAAHGLHDLLHFNGSDLTKVWLSRNPIERQQGERYNSRRLRDEYGLLSSKAAINPLIDNEGSAAKNQAFARINFIPQANVVVDGIPILVGGVRMSTREGYNISAAERFAASIGRELESLPGRLKDGIECVQYHPGYPNNRIIIKSDDDEDFLKCAEDIAVHVEYFEKTMTLDQALLKSQKRHPGIKRRLQTLIEYKFLGKEYLQILER